MLGKPKFNFFDKVSFKIQDKTYTGKVYVIDKYGTFDDNSDVSYDILVDECEEFPDGCIFKHINEKYII